MVRMNSLGSIFKDIIDKMSQWMAAISCIAVVIMMLSMAADAIGRKIIGTVPGAYETTEGMLVVVCLAPLAYVQLYRSHIVVDILINRMSPKIQSYIAISSAILGFLLFALLTWIGFEKAWEATILGEKWYGIVEYPAWPFRWFIPLGTGLLALQLGRTAVDTLTE